MITAYVPQKKLPEVSLLSNIHQPMSPDASTLAPVEAERTENSSLTWRAAKQNNPKEASNISTGLLGETVNTYGAPFEYAKERRKISKEKAQIEKAAQIQRKISKEVENKAAKLSYQTNHDSFVAVLEGVRKSETGQYLSPVIDTKNGAHYEIEITPEQARRLKVAQEILKPAYAALKPYFEKERDGSLRVKSTVDESEGQAGTINAAFFIKALLEYYRDGKLSASEKLSVYVNLGGMGVALGGDGIELGKLVSQIMASGGAAEAILQRLGGVVEKVNPAVILFNMGLDAYQLATGEDPVQKTAAGIDLGFNGMALGLQVAPRMVAAIVPEAAESIAGFGVLGVPAMGLGIGFSALGTQIAGNNQEVHQFYKYLSTFYRASKEGIYSYKNGTLLPTGVPIFETNLRTGRVIPDKVQLRATEPAATHDSAFDRFIQQASGAVPQSVRDKKGKPMYVNILRDQKQKLHKNAHVIAASAMPKLKINYNYAYSATSRSEYECKIDTWIQAQGPYKPSNSWGNLRPVIDAGSVGYEPHISGFVLDNKPVTIILPPKETPSIFLANTTFLIEGFGSTCLVRNLYGKTQLILKDQERTASIYHLEIPEYDLLEAGAVTQNGNQLCIKDKGKTQITVDISELQEGSTITCIGKNGRVRRSFKVGEKNVKITALNVQKIPHWENQLRQMSGELANFVFISQGPSDQGQPFLWDTKNNHLITPPENYPKLNADSQKIDSKKVGPVQLVGITDQYVFFLDQGKQILLQSDRLTNLAIASYELKFNDFENDLQIVAVGDQIYLTQNFKRSKGKVLTLLHELKEDGIELSEVRGLDENDFWKIQKFSKEFLTILKDTEKNGDPSMKPKDLFEEIFAWELHLPEGREEDRTTRKAKLSEWVRLQASNEGQTRTLLFNIKYASSVLLKPGTEKSIVIDSGWYPPETGGGWLVLWNPETKKAEFLKLSPSPLDPDISKAVAEANLRTKIRRLIPEEKEVMAFKNPGGSVILVSTDGKRISFFDEYGVGSDYNPPSDAEKDLEEIDFGNADLTIGEES